MLNKFHLYLHSLLLQVFRFLHLYTVYDLSLLNNKYYYNACRFLIDELVTICQYNSVAFLQLCSLLTIKTKF